MTPTHSAARADSQQRWQAGLRISEVTQTLSDFKLPGTAYAYLQAGWKWLERRRTLQHSSRRLRISETISLGEKRSVSIVQVDGAQFLIGCSTGSVQLLAVLGNESVVSCASGTERTS